MNNNFKLALLLLAFWFAPEALAQSCITNTNPVVSGLATAPRLNQNLITQSSICIIDPKAAFVPYKIPTFDSLKSLYFEQHRSMLVNKHLPTSPGAAADQTVINSSVCLNYHDDNYLIQNNLTISDSIRGSQTKQIFVDGDLNINKNIIYGDAKSGLVFVVKGNVIINPSVTQIDAVIISQGTIFTNGQDCFLPLPVTPGTDRQLMINGSLISLNPSSPPKFCRKLADNTQPAELVNHQIKYLVILRYLLTDNIQKWSEISASESLPTPGPVPAVETFTSPPPPEADCNYCGINGLQRTTYQNACGETVTCTPNYPTITVNTCTQDGCLSPAGGGSQLPFTSGTTCEENDGSCLLRSTISRCSADGCSSINGGTAITYHTELSCLATPCTLQSTQTQVCGGSNINSCNADGTRKQYHNGAICTAQTCDYPYYPAPGQQASICGTRTSNSQPPPDFNDSMGCKQANGITDAAFPALTNVFGRYYPGTQCSQSSCKPNPGYTCPSGCHGSSSGFNGTDCTGSQGCVSNVASYTQTPAAACGSHYINACNNTDLPANVSFDSTAGRRKYYDGNVDSNNLCTTDLCGYPYSDVPGGEHDTVCGAASDSTHDTNGCTEPGGSLKTYYSGSSCSRGGNNGTCKPNSATQATDTNCPTNTCHNAVYGYNGTDCTRTLICDANYTANPGYTASNQTAICGTDASGTIDNHLACLTGAGITMDNSVTPGPRRKYSDGASCIVNQTCAAPNSQQASICGTRTSNSQPPPDFNDSMGCKLADEITAASYPADTNRLGQYYPGNSCSQSPCKPNPGYTCPSGCHGSSSGFNGTDCTGATSCSATFPSATYPGKDTSCGTAAAHYASACVNATTAKTYYHTPTAASCSTASCPYPWSETSGGEHDTVCGTRTGTAPNEYDSKGCDNSDSTDPSKPADTTRSTAGSLRSYYTGFACSKTGACKPNPITPGCTTAENSSCHGARYGFDGTSCTTVARCAANNTDSTQSTSCTASGCETFLDSGVDAPEGGGVQDKYALANSCSSDQNCTLKSTYDKQCRVGGVSTGALICTPSTQTPPAYHTNASCTAVTCEYNYINSGNAEACTADGCTAACTSSGCGSVDTYVAANSCTAAASCTPTSTQTSVCGASNSTPCNTDGTRKYYHAANTCTASTCGFPAATTEPDCHMDAVTVYSGSNCGTSVAANCTTFCNDGRTGMRCYVSSRVVYDSAIPTTMWWKDTWRYKDDIIEVRDTSGWTVQNLDLRRENCPESNDTCGIGSLGYHEFVSVSGLQQSARDHWGWGLPAGFARTYVPSIYGEGQSCITDRDNCSTLGSNWTYHDYGNIYVK